MDPVSCRTSECIPLFSGGVGDKYGKSIFVVNEQSRNAAGSWCVEFTRKQQITDGFYIRRQAEMRDDYGYNTIFIPVMRRLSPTYDEYMIKLQKAGQIFLLQYQQ